MRISLYIQKIAFTMALLTPLAMLAVGFTYDILYITGYGWIIGIIASLWHRLVIEDSKQ